MLKERILLPGITVLPRLVGEVRKAENDRLHALLSGRLSAEMDGSADGHTGSHRRAADAGQPGDGGDGALRPGEQAADVPDLLGTHHEAERRSQGEASSC
ncbi:hypothetical protein [Streptosporangium vulgare]|uniref:Uncharacterized protein n=2 Tax=Streptosporangium vulgare TaxID=46190 RepID=A0ABV5TRF7_9ACTN